MTAALHPRVEAGAILFARYAFPPNRLGHCGPEASDTIREYILAARSDGGLVALERRFEGAYPYLKLIAGANAIADPFDRRVVEAYWIGNACLDHVGQSAFYKSLVERFRPRMGSRAFHWLSAQIAEGARPHHNFHVFDVYLKAGLHRDPHADVSLAHLDQCRISWGKIVTVAGPELVVRRRPLVLRQGRLWLDPPQEVRVRWHGGAAAPGENVSLHWDWACEVLRPAALRALVRETAASLENANLII